MKSPLAIYVVYHTHYAEAVVLFSNLYKLLCRDIRNSLSDGLDIPVYFATETNNFDVDFERAAKTFVLLLADTQLYLSRENILPKIREWQTKSEADKSIVICPVKLCKYAFEVLPSDSFLQSIVLKSYNIEDNWEEFQTKIYDGLIRFINDQYSKNQIFVSHSKKDTGKLGEVRAKELVRYLNEETKLSSFFDVKDILEGDRFDKQIENGVENALLIVLYTNSYSDREWCRRELIAAKDHHVPTIVVMMMDGVTKRVFPYIGNTPCIEFDGDWRKPINLLLRTALDEFYENTLLSTLKAGNANISILPFPPELYNIRSLPSEISQVLYPEPPLGQEELNILKQTHSRLEFVTPMEYASANLNLEGKYIALSISNSDDAYQYGIAQEMLDDISIEISKHILKARGKMIYGGDLRKGGFTELLANLSYQYGAYEKSDSIVKYFKNYLACPYHKDLKDEDVLLYDHNRVKLVRVEAGVDVADSLTKMRVQMEEDASARIIIGGKQIGFSGKMPGIIEEFMIAIEAGHPVYVIGGFGGASRYVANVISGKIMNGDLYDWLKAHGFERLNNGLSDEDNGRLFASTNLMEIVSLILKGLKNKFNNEA